MCNCNEGRNPCDCDTDFDLSKYTAAIVAWAAFLLLIVGLS